MKKLFIVIILILFAFSLAYAQAPDWPAVEKVFGRQGAAQGDIFKITFPRSDLKVKIGEVAVEPALALTSWIAFKPMGNQAMMMGDLVLLESEIAPVVSKLMAESLEVTAIHNHILNESPKVMYLHFSGRGDAQKLAESMKNVLSLTGTPMGVLPTLLDSSIDWSKMEAILGRSGQHRGSVIQFGFPRKEKITEDGMEIPPFIGMATGINLQKVGEKAATTGDFVLLGSEVNLVVRALTENGLAVTAIHSHMLFESPRLFFLHFWGYDDPEKLARGLKAALGKTNSITGK